MEKLRTTIWFQKGHIEAIQNEAFKWTPKESGGILIGYWANEHEAVITAIIGPGTNAIHTTNSYVPDQEYHVQEITRIYHESGRTETYLGDWHTHPNAEAYLSPRDKKTIKNIANYKPARLNKPLMLILGTNPLELKIWVLERKGFFKRSIINICNICMY